MIIKTKLFLDEPNKRVDQQLTDFMYSHQVGNDRLIDIKYQAMAMQYDGVTTSALLIYKTDNIND
jgi:hypothetical protein